jgi:hypothetical protein
LVETVRTADGPRQRILCHLGELNDSAQGRWLKTIEVFNEAGERHQLKLFPADIPPPPDESEVAQVLVQRVRVERMRQLGPCLVGFTLWQQLHLVGTHEVGTPVSQKDSPLTCPEVRERNQGASSEASMSSDSPASPPFSYP